LCGYPAVRMADHKTSATPSPAVPRLVAFDLDDTLWHPEMEMCAGAPFTRDAKGVVRDCSGIQTLTQ